MTAGGGVVDAHAHVFAPTPDELRPADDLAPAERTARLEELWEAGAAVGVEGAVLVPLATDDTTCAAALARDPGRCAGVAVAGPDDLGPGAAARLRDRRAAYPFSAVRLMWLGAPGRPLPTSAAWPLLEELAEQDLVLWSYLPPDQAPLLGELAERLPTLRIVLNHLGFAPDAMVVDEHRRPRFPGALDAATVDRVRALADHPGMHLMVSGHYALTRADVPYHDLADATRTLVATYGAERCLWGSDFPWPAADPGYVASHAAVRAMLADCGERELDLIFGGTVRRLFPDAFTKEIP
jgi:L-fuconolactonase